MKVSEVTIESLAEYLNEPIEDLSESEKNHILTLKSVATSYIQGYTGLGAEDIDDRADLVIVIFILVADMYDNKSLYINDGGRVSSSINKVVDTILGMHSVNLL